MREAYRRFQDQSKTNFTKLVAESVGERLKVVGFRTGGDGSDALDKDAWQWWQDNHLDADSGLVHRAALTMSRAYVIVGRDPDNPDQPLVTAEDPRQVIHESSPTNRRKLVAALKTWWDDINSWQCAVVYLPSTVYYFHTDKMTQETTVSWRDGNWTLDTADPYPTGSAPNPLGVVPVVPFLNCPDLQGDTLGEYEDTLPIQDRINTQVLDRMVISAMQAYRQRWATGVDLTDENGEPTGGFDPGADLLWNVSDEAAKFGEFSPADLTSCLKAVESDVQHLAAITRTPPHYLLGAMVNISGDALAAAETGLTSKVIERSVEFGEAWESVYMLAGMLQGREIPSDCEVIWSDPQFRTLTEMAAASVQLVTAGVPWRTRMGLLDFTPSQIDRMVIERTQDAMMASVLTPPAPTTPLTPAHPPVTAGGPDGKIQAEQPAGSMNGAEPV